MGCSPWGRKVSGTTERLTLTYLLINRYRDMRGKSPDELSLEANNSSLKIHMLTEHLLMSLGMY